MDFLNNDKLHWFTNAANNMNLEDVRQIITNQILIQRHCTIQTVSTIITIFMTILKINIVIIYGFRLLRVMFTATFVELVTCVSIICFWLAMLLPVLTVPNDQLIPNLA